MNILRRGAAMVAVVLAMALSACTDSLPPAPADGMAQAADSGPYVIGPLDSLEVFVWRAPDLSTTVQVRPDGRVSMPLVEDMEAAGKTPTELAGDLREALKPYVQDPIVTVMMREFGGPLDRRVKVVGEARQPLAIPYRANMTVLDVMIEVGGLTEFAAGDRAVLIRHANGERKEYRLRLDSLLREGDVSANVAVMPGDVILIPETFI